MDSIANTMFTRGPSTGIHRSRITVFTRVRVQMISSETGRIMDDPAITLAVVRSDLERSDFGEFVMVIASCRQTALVSHSSRAFAIGGV